MNDLPPTYTTEEILYQKVTEQKVAINEKPKSEFNINSSVGDNKYQFVGKLFERSLFKLMKFICKFKYKAVPKAKDIQTITQKANNEMISDEFMTFIVDAL